VSGIAGSGKTTLLREVVPVLRADGHDVILLAPTSPSERNLKEAFPEAQSLQSFETDLEKQRQLRPGTVIVLDEISMVSMPQACRLVKWAAAKGHRLITLGDRDQFGSVERGEVIRLWQDSGSVRSVTLTETYRAQEVELSKTVKDLKAGRQEPERRVIAFNRQEAKGDVREIQDTAEMRASAVDLHMAAVREGHLAIMCSPTHAEGRETAAIVRELMKMEGLIDGADHTVTRLVRLDIEGIELRDLRHYAPDRTSRFQAASYLV
jgi:ATP-dependent exoDNAse (exonuclease V) alpha subunit